MKREKVCMTGFTVTNLSISGCNLQCLLIYPLFFWLIDFKFELSETCEKCSSVSQHSVVLFCPQYKDIQFTVIEE